jgi:hypothetical protein
MIFEIPSPDSTVPARTRGTMDVAETQSDRTAGTPSRSAGIVTGALATARGCRRSSSQPAMISSIEPSM